MLGEFSQEARAQDREREIERIRARYAEINRDTQSYATVSRRLENYAVEGADLTGYFAGDDLRRIVARYFAESGFGREEYYFWNGDLFFVFRQKHRASQANPGLQWVDENRFYFAAGRLIRWVDENHRRVVIEQPAARDEERRLLAEASKFAGMLTTVPRGEPVRAAPAVPAQARTHSPVSPEGRSRARLAAQHQEALRSEGCPGCRVWVDGDDNRILQVLDPEAPSGNNDYRGTPVLWFSAGFTEVIYYSRPGVIYARHRR